MEEWEFACNRERSNLVWERSDDDNTSRDEDPRSGEVRAPRMSAMLLT